MHQVWRSWSWVEDTINSRVFIWRVRNEGVNELIDVDALTELVLGG